MLRVPSYLPRVRVIWQSGIGVSIAISLLLGGALPSLSAADPNAPLASLAASVTPPTTSAASPLSVSPATVAVPESTPVTPFEQNLQRIFADDQEADIRVIFGYDNSADIRHVNDPFRAEHFMEYLKKAGFCPAQVTEAERQRLGVTDEAQNLRLFDGLGVQGHKLRLSMIWSARTTSFARNIGSEYLQQVKCSEQALKFMQKAATDAEVMIYVGHSREGGGPDTFPPEIKYSGGEYLHRVDFAPYRENRPGLVSLAPYLSKATSKPHIISWTSCKSDTHFQGWFRKTLAQKEQDTSLVMSTRFTTLHPWIAEIQDNDEGLMATVCLIDALRYNPSQAAFERRLNTTCEIESERISGKPAWRVSSVPGNGGAKTAPSAAGSAVAGQ
ncbi:MAG TPA: hypothetical protein VK956_08750 [Verrucomicrobium sp.]|nr:hypothetical protein [Verrucomicrobium sp.]